MGKPVYMCCNCLMTDPKSINMVFYTLHRDNPTDYCDKCIYCNSTSVVKISLTVEELNTLSVKYNTPKDLLEMNKLKQDNIDCFNIEVQNCIKLAEKLKKKREIEKNRQAYRDLHKNTFNQVKKMQPKCPTCGSTNVKKISATSRYASVGLLGLASPNIGKTMCCNSCGYKW